MQEWIVEKLLKVGLPAAIKYGVAFLIAHNANSILGTLGITVDWNKFQAEITVLLGTLMEIVHSHINDSIKGDSK